MRTFNEIVQEIFNITSEEIRDDMSSKDIPELDSMNYLLFIAELENEFSISFGMNEVMDAKTLGDIRLIVEKRKL